jgi:methylmalonyl-CoA/ethylmalonyl-CoA epimerase
MGNDWEINHVGMVVKSKNKILHYLQSLGVGISVGPQPLLPYVEGETTLMMYRKLDGDPLSYTSPSTTPGAHTFYDGESQIGSCQLECIAPGPGSFIHDYLEIKGEGINHLCFNVPDVQTETDKLIEKGCDLIFSAITGGQIVENYLDTRKFGDVIISFRPPAGEWESAWKANNMAYPLVNDWKFRGVGVAVNDLDRTVEYYQSLGFTNVQPEVLVDSTTATDFNVNGRVPDTNIRTRSRLIEIGPLQYEFVQPLEGETVYTESLEQKGEGINNLAFTVDDLDKETSKLVDRGVAIVLSAKPENGEPFAYFDTREVGNTMVKLTQAAGHQ